MTTGTATFDRPFRRGPTGGLAETTSLNDAITAVIVDLIDTDEGELPMEPSFGTRVRRRRYEPNDELLVADLRDSLRTAIARWEPRARLKDVAITAEGKTTWLEVLYTVIDTGKVERARAPWSSTAAP